ncbi:hypothetical protein RA307_30115 [Xanthobacteraceae bacterium Astr-EGSB]|uniref:hypothetical protein n=1 Tax=Astrobacterium formosum TaxID=3069710 RepID=UPI0027B24055|nr:hypothetical protein [Xanthobacteraceae bacterium Astr-EGSB]
MESRLDMHGADKSLAEEVPLVPQDDKDTQDALNKLADEAARATSTLRPAATADFSAGPRPSLADPPVLPAADDLAPEPVQRRRAGVGRFTLAVGLGVAATLAWQSYGETGRQMLAAHVPALAGVLMVSHAPSVSHAPPAGDAAAIQPMAAGETVPPAAPAPASVPPEAPASATPPHAAVPAPVDLTPQIEAMARDLAALRESMARLVAAQDETAKILTKLRTEEESKPVPAPKPRPVAVRRPPPAPAPTPIGRPNPSAGSATVTSAPLSVIPPPPVRRPPAGLP